LSGSPLFSDTKIDKDLVEEVVDEGFADDCVRYKGCYPRES